MIEQTKTGEYPSRIEPCTLESIPVEIADTIARLSAESSRLGTHLHPKTAHSLADLVSVMNCYYSNLIEGHNTKPVDIERALQGRIDDDKRDLQLEASRHIALQREIDALHAEGRLQEPVGLVRWLHGRFYHDAPKAMLDIGGTIMIPGEYRRSNVIVGRHKPPSYECLSEFMRYFEDRYRLDGKGMSAQIVNIATSHHRFNYIHPFLDGNGRVSRLMSHAMSLKAGIGAYGLWSISRGLARGLEDRSEYMMFMDSADAPRMGDLDGRGNLSQKKLVEFVGWFLNVCLDQVSFMANQFELGTLSKRLARYVEIHSLRPESIAILTHVLTYGEMQRGESGRVTMQSERTARDTLKALLDRGLLVSDTPKSAVRLRFSAVDADILFPRIFG
jgi:Fic family protein